MSEVSFCKRCINEVRDSTNISYEASTVAVKSVLQLLRQYEKNKGAESIDFSAILASLSLASQLEPDEWSQTKDGHTIMDAFNALSAYHEDFAQRGWPSGSRSLALTTELNRLLEVCQLANPELVLAALSDYRFRPAEQIIDLMLTDCATGFPPEILCNLLLRFCELSAVTHSQLLDSMIVVELSKQLLQMPVLFSSDSRGDRLERVVDSQSKVVLLLVYALAKGDAAPVRHFEALNDRLVRSFVGTLNQLQRLLADPGYVGLTEKLERLQRLVENLLLALGQQLHPQVETGGNIVAAVLCSDEGAVNDGELFKERLLHLANRAEDPLLSYHGTDGHKNSVLKVLCDCLQLPGYDRFIFVPDQNILIDICLSQLGNHLQPGNSLRVDYLAVLSALLEIKWRQLQEQKHSGLRHSGHDGTLEIYRFHDIEQCLLSVCNDANEAEIELLTSISLVMEQYLRLKADP